MLISNVRLLILDDREYLSRISTIRNALTFRLFQSDDDGDGLIDAKNKDSTSATSSYYKMYHLLPLEKLRTYFGEKVGFYFSWVELFLLSMIAPAIIGLLLFVGGVIYYAIQVNRGFGSNDNGSSSSSSGNSSQANEGDERPETAGYVLAKACDNYWTIFFPIVVIIWGTVLSELWKRRQRWYRELWHVTQFEDNELRRANIYPFKWVQVMHTAHFITHGLMYIPSLLVTFLFICLTWLSIYLINQFDVRLSMKHCKFPPPPVGSDGLVSTVAPAAAAALQSEEDDEGIVSMATSWFLCNILCVILHSLSIVILDTAYTRVCYPLTHLEGHDTQTKFNNWLILKLFAYRFINNYSILFYIAFVIGPDYGSDVSVHSEALSGIQVGDVASNQQARFKTCKQQPCMTQLGKQLLAIIVTSPLIRSLKDRLLPIVLSIVMSVCSKKATKSNKVNIDDKFGTKQEQQGSSEQLTMENEIIEQQKMPELSTLSFREFTIEEFIEKSIMFGAIQMFSVALPPAPALSVLILRIDLNFDIARM